MRTATAPPTEASVVRGARYTGRMDPDTLQWLLLGLALANVALLAMLVLWEFNFNPLALFATAAERYGAGVLAPGRFGRGCCRTSTSWTPSDPSAPRK